MAMPSGVYPAGCTDAETVLTPGCTDAEAVLTPKEETAVGEARLVCNPVLAPPVLVVAPCDGRTDA